MPARVNASQSQQRDGVQPSNDNVLYVGLNPHAKLESQSLRNRGANVIEILDAPISDVVSVMKEGKRQTVSLESREGIADFVSTLGLPLGNRLQLMESIAQVAPGARDEFAKWVQVWAQAEKGASIPSRLVLSAHHNGQSFFGDDNGEVPWSAIAGLAKALPKAAGQVEDLHVAGCYSGLERHRARYREAFPNLKTIWAYDGSAPGSASGATAHLQRWEKATRGQTEMLPKEIAAGTRKGENVSVWSLEGGSDVSMARSKFLEDRSRWQAQQGLFQEYQRGDRVVENPQAGPLRDFYHLLQSLLGYELLSYSDEAMLSKQRDECLRLLYFTQKVAPKFQSTYRQHMKAGCHAIALPVFDFSKLSRKQALAKVAEFDAALSRHRPPPREAVALQDLLHRGLVQLQPSVIPSAWL